MNIDHKYISNLELLSQLSSRKEKRSEALIDSFEAEALD